MWKVSIDEKGPYVTKSAAQIRREFIEFFEQRGHAFVPGAPVVPYDDPTLLFTNAGMNQFKDVFLATGSRKYTRAANSQPCIRAGGKHNDLDDVGRDTYHHTFFEMLGNWSFGDYFKREAIAWAWELLTKVWGLDHTRLHATYFGGDPAEHLEPDEEARDLWIAAMKAAGLDESHVHAGGKKDNFWEMGDTGPCGPCSEIHIDLTPDKSGAGLVNAGDARVIEIWNLVFIQFNRGPDGRLTPLPAKHVDTGMGFERVTAVIQGKQSNYDTDVFAPIFQAIREITGAPAYKGLLPGQSRDEPRTSVRAESDASTQPNAPRGLKPAAPRGATGDQQQLMIDISYRVIADHARCLTFALTDGAVPDREGRGYVLRRILRRGVRYGWQYMNMHEPFLYKLVPAVVASLGEAFPQLKKDPARVAAIIREEEESFDRTLDRGIELFEEAADYAIKHHHGEIRGADAFKLHDTYGFPIDLTQIMADEKGLKVDIGEYERLMEQARERARSGGKTEATIFGHLNAELVTSFGATDESPKYETDHTKAKVLGVVRFAADGTATLLAADEPLKVGDQAGLVFDRTCFYAEQGGQIGDVGEVSGPSLRFDVEETRRFADTIVHFGTLVMGAIKVGDELELRVDEKRKQTKQNHTATHVMNWALREVLGEHVQQKGSLVDPEKTRFDFSHNKALTPEEIARVEELVNGQIRHRLPVYDEYIPQDKALKINGLRAVFGEKYPDVVRVMSVGVPVSELLASPASPKWRNVSIEFCGGTHCRNTSEIECFAITAEEAVAKGIRRVVGVSGVTAQFATELGASLLQKAENLKRTAEGKTPEELSAALSELQQTMDESLLRVLDRIELREALGELQRLVKLQQKQEAAAAQDVVTAKVDELLASVTKVGETAVVVAEMPDVPVEQLKTGADRIKQKCGSAAVLFGVKTGDKALLLASMSSDLIKRGLKAGDLVKEIAKLVGGGGGGPPTMAQAGGKHPEKLGEALAAGKQWIESKLSQC